MAWPCIARQLKRVHPPPSHLPPWVTPSLPSTTVRWPLPPRRGGVSTGTRRCVGGGAGWNPLGGGRRGPLLPPPPVPPFWGGGGRGDPDGRRCLHGSRPAPPPRPRGIGRGVGRRYCRAGLSHGAHHAAAPGRDMLCDRHRWARGGGGGGGGGGGWGRVRGLARACGRLSPPRLSSNRLPVQIILSSRSPPLRCSVTIPGPPPPLPLRARGLCSRGGGGGVGGEEGEGSVSWVRVGVSRAGSACVMGGRRPPLAPRSSAARCAWSSWKGVLSRLHPSCLPLAAPPASRATPPPTLRRPPTRSPPPTATGWWGSAPLSHAGLRAAQSAPVAAPLHQPLLPARTSPRRTRRWRRAARVCLTGGHS